MSKRQIIHIPGMCYNRLHWVVKQVLERQEVEFPPFHFMALLTPFLYTHIHTHTHTQTKKLLQAPYPFWKVVD